VRAGGLFIHGDLFPPENHPFHLIGRFGWRTQVELPLGESRKMVHEDLKKEIEKCSGEEIDAVLERARRQSDEILREAKRKAEQIRSESLEDAEQRAEIEKTRALYRAKSEVKNLINAEKNAVYQESFSQAFKRLEEARKNPEYGAVFRKLLLDALSEVDSQNPVIHIDQRDEELCRNVLSTLGVNASVISDLDSMGGVEVTSPEGSVSVSNTIESRLEKSKSLLKPEIFSRLYGE
jgi:V/A-type H+-transporting ATPase subunit E